MEFEAYELRGSVGTNRLINIIIYHKIHALTYFSH